MLPILCVKCITGGPVLPEEYIQSLIDGHVYILTVFAFVYLSLNLLKFQYVILVPVMGLYIVGRTAALVVTQ